MASSEAQTPAEGRKGRVVRRRSIRSRVLILLLGLTIVTVLGVGYLGVSAVQSTGRAAQNASADALRTQAKEYLRQVTVGDRQKIDLILDGVARDAEMMAQYGGQLFENEDAFGDGNYWRAEDHMFVASDGQYMNSEEDVSSAYVPAFIEVDDETRRALELGAYMDLVFAPTYEEDANTVAVYMGTEYETTQYHPNIGLGSIVGPEFTVTERPWYLSASPENNPDREVVWSSVYVDATGKGLMVTAAAPVYAGGEFVGAVGVDVTLEDIATSVKETRLLGSGYGFLIDEEGGAIALPEDGYQDILGRDPEPDEVRPDLSGSDTPFGVILADMTAGEQGSETITVDGRELYVAYAPLGATGWSLANVVEAESVLQTLASLESDLTRSARSMVLTRLLPVGAAILAIVAAAGLAIARRLTHPLQEIAGVAERIGAGDWDVSLPPARSDEVGALVDAFKRMTDELRELYGELEEKVAAQTRNLRQRTIQLQASSQVAREASAIRDVGKLLDQTVDLISDRFGFYHAGIFLLDEAQQYAVLRAASSEGGSRMLARQHKLRVGEMGIVGYVAGAAEPRIALDVGADAVFFDNPDLPETRSEMALPLRVRDEVIGVLDVQSTEAAAFTEEDLEVLQTMADQLALAIENARLLEEASARVREVGALLQQESREGWRRTLGDRDRWGYGYDRVEVVPRQEIDHRDDPQLKLPIHIRGETVGELDLEWLDHIPTDEEQALARAVVEEAGQALESARLFTEARQRAREQSVLSDLGQALAAQLDADEVLQAAHQGVSKLIDAGGFFIGLHDPERQEIVIRLNATSAAAEGVAVVRADEGLSGDVIRTGEPVLADGHLMERLSEDEIRLIGEPARSWMGVPLVVADRVMGVMAVQSYEKEGAYDEHDLGLLTAAANQTAIALESARLYDEAVRTAERLREVDRLKSQFLANMSHELRTPLNSIIGFSRVVLKGIDGPITERQREDLSAIYNSGQHLLGLINDILDVSKIEAGKMDLDFEIVDLGQIVDGVLSTAVALVKDKPVELKRAIPDDLPTVIADERRVRQVLLNLVSNASKFTDEGFIRVAAEVDGGEVCVSVTDTGPGIAQEQIDEIFEPFTQVDASTTREHGGTGLGLTISHSFIQLHGGRMWVESEPARGSTFYFSLPLEGPPPEVERREEAVEEAVLIGPEESLEDGSGPVVLCIDDDTGVLDLYRRYLQPHGYRVIGLTDSRQAVDVADRLWPYAITLDVIMPDRDGWDVIHDLKGDARTSDIPVILCSIVAEEERGMRLGAADYLVKPIMEEDLVAALERLGRQSDGRTVLIVDDDQEDRQLLRRMIESEDDYQVIEAAGGQQAMALIADLRPQVVILDLLMPEVDGFAVLESIKSDETTRSIPVVVVTEKELTEDDRRRLGHRVEALIHKGGLEQKDLLDQVSVALRKRHRRGS